MSLTQLKPHKQVFYQMCKNLEGRFRTLILCEGKRDTEVLKGIITRLEIPPTGNIGVTDCGGSPAIRDIARYTETLARLSRKLETMVVMIDADEHTFKEKVQSFVESLMAHNISIEGTDEIAESLYNVRTERLNILVQMAGMQELPFPKHTIDDHITQLLLLEGRISQDQLQTATSTKEIIDEQTENARTIIENSQRELVEQAFGSIIGMLKML